MTDAGPAFGAPLRRLARHSAVYAAADLVAKGGAYALIPVLTRGLGADDFGAYTLVTSIVPMLTLVASLGLGGAVTRLWFDLDTAARRRFHLAAWLSLQTAALGLAALLTAVAGPLFDAVFPRVSPRLFLFGVWTSFFLASATVPLAVLRAEERPKRFAALAASQFVAPAAGVVVALTAGAGVRGALWGHLGGAAVVFALSAFSLAGLAGRPADWPMVRPALALGLPVVPHLVAHWALNVVDRVAIQRTLGAAAVGLYAVGYQIAQGTSLVASAINNAVVPSFYRAAQDGRREALGRAWTPLLYATGAVAAGVSLFGEEAVALLAPPRFRATADVIPWVALGYWLLSAYYFPVNALFYAKRVGIIPVATVAAASLNYALNLWLLPRHGLIAAAWNTAIAYGVLLLIVTVAAARVMPLPYRFARTAALGAAGAAVTLASAAVPDGAAGTALKVPLFAAWLAFGWTIVRGELDAVRSAGRDVAEPGASRRVVCAAATATQARTMVACAGALRAAGFEPVFVSLDPILGRSASAGFAGESATFVEHGEPPASERTRTALIVLRGRAQARTLVAGAAAVIVGNDFTPFERLVIAEARRAGVASILVQDGVIALAGDQAGGGARSGSALVTLAKRGLALAGFPFEPKPYGSGGCDAVCVYGPTTRDALSSRGVPASAIRITGQPRYDTLRPKAGRRARGPVIVATQPFARYGLATREQEAALFGTMIEAALDSGREVVVKLHPDTDPASRAALERRIAGQASVEQLDPIERLYERAAAIVTLSSTTALEALIVGLGVVVVEAPGFPTTLPYTASGAVEAARSPQEIAPAIERALAGGGRRSAARATFLAEHLAPLDGRAAERVAAAVRSAVDGRRPVS